jgi:hypothetical protein
VTALCAAAVHTASSAAFQQLLFAKLHVLLFALYCSMRNLARHLPPPPGVAGSATALQLWLLRFPPGTHGNQQATDRPWLLLLENQLLLLRLLLAAAPP